MHWSWIRTTLQYLSNEIVVNLYRSSRGSCVITCNKHHVNLFNFESNIYSSFDLEKELTCTQLGSSLILVFKCVAHTCVYNTIRIYYTNQLLVTCAIEYIIQLVVVIIANQVIDSISDSLFKAFLILYCDNNDPFVSLSRIELEPILQCSKRRSIWIQCLLYVLILSLHEIIHFQHQLYC